MWEEKFFKVRLQIKIMKVYFMRHGESEYNTKELINSNPLAKISLTKEGKEQVEKTAKKLIGMRFDAIYASEFLRAKESAAIMNRGRNLEIKTDKRLNEMKMGFEGESFTKYVTQREESGNITTFKISGGESFADVKKRVLNFLEDLKKERYGRVLIVAHEIIVMVARAIFGELGDEDSLANPIKNARYFMFDM